MGVAATVAATLLSGYMYGKAAQSQMNAAASQQETQAEIYQKNSEKVAQQAEQESQNNAINMENKRRRLNLMEGQQRAAIGASGIATSGSALGALMDTRQNIDSELGMDAYNGKQKVTGLFNQSTDYYNQSNINRVNADNYRAAGKRAFWNSMLGSAFSLAGNLYSGKSSAVQQQQSASSLGDYTKNAEGNFILRNSDYTFGSANSYIGSFGKPRQTISFRA